MRGWLIYTAKDAKRNEGIIQIYNEESINMQLDLPLVLADFLTIGIENGVAALWYKGERITPPTFAICRTIDITLTVQLEAVGVRVFNNATVARICNDKIRTYQLAAECGVATVDTIFSDGVRENRNHYAYPFVIKASGGRGGADVWLVKNEADYQQALQKMNNRPFVHQRLAGRIGQDLRVYVLGNEMVAAILRKSETDFRANYCLGGEATVYKLSNAEKETVERIISRFDFGLVGIDWLFDKDGQLLLNEIEDVVGARALYAKTKLNIAKEYLLYITKCCQVNASRIGE